MENNDLGKEQELSIAVMNLIAIEEHLAFTAGKTKDEKYIDIYNEIRKLRSKYMGEIVKNREGECWCISKHLLATVMRLFETGIKQKDKKEAMKYFGDALETYQLFWMMQNIK